ncbi:hypothetical protein U1Q18_010541 [Sarracenia purpurea var. burkii]
MPQTNAQSSSIGPKSPIKNLQEVGLCGDTNRFESLLEDPEINEEINEEIPATPTSASHSDAVHFLSEIAATSTSTGTLDHPTSAVVPNQIVIAGQMDDIPASEHIDISEGKGVVEAPGPPQSAPIQPMPSPCNKKLGRGKKNKRSLAAALAGRVVPKLLCCLVSVQLYFVVWVCGCLLFSFVFGAAGYLLIFWGVAAVIVVVP